MSGSEGKTAPEHLREARAEAAAWVVRLHGPSRCPELEAGLRRWLRADPLHAREFERVTEAWDAGAQVPAAGLPRVRGQRRLGPTRLLAVGASVTAVLLVLVFLAFSLARPGSDYRTGPGRHLTVRLRDGSRIRLDTDSEIRVSYNNTERWVRLETGRAYFQVAHDPSWPFVVVVGRHQITDIGTTFMVRYGPAGTAVTLIEGRVAVSSRSLTVVRRHEPGRPRGVAPGGLAHALASNSGRHGASSGGAGRALILAPGERVTFTKGAPPKVDQPRIADVTAWVSGEVMLDDTPLGTAIARLNRDDSTPLVIEDPRIARLRVSGVYHTGDNHQFAVLVSKLYGLAFSEHGGRILLSAGPRRR